MDIELSAIFDSASSNLQDSWNEDDIMNDFDFWNKTPSTRTSLESLEESLSLEDRHIEKDNWSPSSSVCSLL